MSLSQIERGTCVLHCCAAMHNKQAYCIPHKFVGAMVFPFNDESRLFHKGYF